MKESFGTEKKLTKNRMRMALLPSKARLVSVPDLWVPVVVMGEKVYVYPGIPPMFEKMLHVCSLSIPSHIHDPFH
tara:strand:+ start:318 stop:542 length:225 start_codon:yes stop_codon:yes gene_type:complete